MERLMTIVTAAGLGCAAACTAPSTELDPEPLPVESIGDQRVLRNTLEPRSAVVSVAVPGGPGEFLVEVTPADVAVLDPVLMRCTSNPCELPLVPDPGATATTSVVVDVEAGGRTGSTSFQLAVEPHWVVDAASDGPGTLRAVVAGAMPGDVVAFDTTGAFSRPTALTLDLPVDLASDITIEGPGADQLTLAGPSGALRVVGPAVAHVLDLAFEDSTITDPQRGAITVEPDAHLVLRGARLAGNEATRGAGIYVTDATLDVADTELEGNQAAEGAAIAATRSMVEIGPGTRFVANEATGNGGGLWTSDSTVQVSDSVLEGNTALSGAAVAMVDGGRLDVTGTTFDANRAAADGGAVFTLGGTATTIQASTFLGNHAESSGGALSLQDEVEAQIEGSTFTSNVAEFLGAGVQATVTSTVSLSDCLFDRNEAPFGIVLMTNGSVRDVRVVDNTVSVGSLWLESGTVEVTDTTVSGNTATSYAPGLFLASVQATVSGGSIVDNVGPEGDTSYGGGVLASGGSATFTGVEIERNTGGNGAGLYVAAGATVTLRDSSVAENGGLQVRGAGAYVADGGSLILEEGTQLRANTTLETGGGVLVQAGAELTVRDAIIGGDQPADGNQSNNGGGIFNIGTVSLTAASIIQHNRANVGGGLFQGQSAVGSTIARLGGATITHNAADVRGGGIYLVGDNNVTASSSVTITSNSADQPDGGGGLYRAGPFSAFFACDFPVSRVFSNLDGTGEIDNVQPSPGGC